MAAGAQPPVATAGRAVLAEIPAWPGGLRVTDETPPPGYLSPMSSPDEQIIRQRGRKRQPIIWSPDLDLKSITFSSQPRTPPRASAPPPRTSPRKRLFTDRREQIPFSPDKIDFTDLSTPKKLKLNSPTKGTPPKKRPRIEKTPEAESDVPIETALMALSPAQLIAMMGDMARRHPDMEREMRRDMPEPDLTPLEENLIYLKSNIFKSLPKSRLSSKTDATAYSRVATHLAAFKRCVVSQGRALVASRQWGAVLRYAAAAWGHVRDTPVWDAAPHNASRDLCFRALAAFCMTAVKKAGMGRAALLRAHDTLRAMAADCHHLHSCLHYIQAQLTDLYYE